MTVAGDAPRAHARAPVRRQHEHVRERVEIDQRRDLDDLDERVARVVDLRHDADRDARRQPRVDAELLASCQPLVETTSLTCTG